MATDLSLMTDEELMELYQGGNELAFNALYGRYSPKVYGFIRKRLRDPQATNDVFQIVFTKFHKSRDQFDSSLPFAPWVFTITRTALLDWHKQKFRLNRKSERIAAEPVSEESISAKPEINLSPLPEIQRTAIELRYFEDLPYEEIALRLKTSPANVRQLVSRGLNRLRLAMKPIGGNHES